VPFVHLPNRLALLAALQEVWEHLFELLLLLWQLLLHQPLAWEVNLCLAARISHWLGSGEKTDTHQAQGATTPSTEAD